jgi:hypothetical protein
MIGKPKPPTAKDYRKFGLGLFVILGLIGGVFLWRDRAAWAYFWAVGGAALILSLAWPTGLKPVYRFFMWLADKLAWINSRIILTVVYFLIFSPIGLFFRLIRKDLLDQKIDPETESYWQKRDDPEFDPKHYLRQF